MLTEQQTLIHKEFRKYLHTSEGKKATCLTPLSMQQRLLCLH